MVTRFGDDTDFIFDLHHEDGVRFSIGLAEVTHESREGTRVRIANRGVERGKPLSAPAIARLDTRKPIEIRLDPCRRIAGIGVFPCAEPQDNELQVVLAGSLEKTIHALEIESSLCRF